MKLNPLILAFGLIPLVGCGSDSSNDNNTTTGTAYYVDSAVSGVNYTCGTQQGKTAEDGAFLFDIGEKCSFSLGAIPLRDIDIDDLQDGATIQETDINIARILQSTDEDGDPSNGININTEMAEVIAQAMESLGYSSISSFSDAVKNNADDSDVVFIAFENKLSEIATAANVSIPIVSKDDASAHLITSILSDATVIEAGYAELTSLTFNSELSAVNWTNQLTNESGTSSIEINGTTLTVSEGEAKNFTISLGDEGYITKTGEENESRLYGSLEEATRYLVEASLAEKTLYSVAASGWAESWTANSDLSSIDWDASNMDGSSGTNTMSYSDLVLTQTNDADVHTFTFTDFNSDFLSYERVSTKYSSTSGRLYFDQTKADSYAASLDLDDDTETLEFTADMLSGKSWYTPDFYQINFTDYTLSTVSLSNPEEEEEGYQDYTIEDGKIITDGVELRLTGSDSNSYTITETDLESSETETFFVYTNKATFDATLVNDISTTTTITDSSSDATNTTQAGFELTNLSVIEDTGNLVIKLTSSGSITSALASVAPENYTNTLWIGINNYLEFGMQDGTWLLEDMWTDGEYTGGSFVEGGYSSDISSDGTTLTLTLSTDLIPANEYLLIEASVAADFNNESSDGDTSTDETNDEIPYDSISLGALWSSGASSDEFKSGFTTGWLNGKTLYNVYLEEDEETGMDYWETSVFSFTDSTFDGYNLENPTDAATNISYEITDEGYITFECLDDVCDTPNEYIRAFSDEGDYLTLIWADDLISAENSESAEEEYFFYGNDAQANAAAFIEDNPVDTLAGKLAGKTWAEFKPDNDFPTSCYAFSGTSNDITAYFNVDDTGGKVIQYQVTGASISYMQDGQVVSSTDTFTANNDGTFSVDKVWSDDEQTRTWKNMPNCLEELEDDSNDE